MDEVHRLKMWYRILVRCHVVCVRNGAELEAAGGEQLCMEADHQLHVWRRSMRKPLVDHVFEALSGFFLTTDKVSRNRWQELLHKLTVGHASPGRVVMAFQLKYQLQWYSILASGP